MFKPACLPMILAATISLGLTWRKLMPTKLISFTLANNEQVRFVADDVMTRMTRDQDFQKALENLRTYRFDNLIEALNVCASHGWEVRSTMVLEGRNGQEQHVLLARPIDTMMPVSPWLDRVPEDARSRQRQR